jgi:anionic cell wall polymer biosynthesis LytR-Cps2A-Psr (LCP) family protein
MMRKKIHFVSRDLSVFLLIAILLLLAGGIVFSVLTFRSDPVEELLSNDRVISVVYIIEQDQMPLSTYVVMCYPKTGRAAIFDIPGEVGMLIRQTNRVDSIDTVYSPGRASNYINLIESLLGIDIAFSIVMDTDNLGRAVDLIEGVELFIPSVVRIQNEDSLVLFPSGLSRLDGDKARAYISYRSPDEDPELAVFRRQRFFLGFLKRQAEMNDALKNPAVFRIYQSFMQSSLSQRGITRLFDEFAGIDLDRTSIQSVAGNQREVSGKVLLIPSFDGSLVKDIVRQVLISLTNPADSFFTDRAYTVEVLNGTTVTGLAGRTAEVLRGFGYDIISIGNADNSEHERTLVIDRSGMEMMVRNFAGIIRCNNINFESPIQDNPDAEFTMQSQEYHADFTLIIGKDFDGRYVIGN